MKFIKAIRRWISEKIHFWAFIGMAGVGILSLFCSYRYLLEMEFGFGLSGLACSVFLLGMAYSVMDENWIFERALEYLLGLLIVGLRIWQEIIKGRMHPLRVVLLLAIPFLGICLILWQLSLLGTVAVFALALFLTWLTLVVPLVVIVNGNETKEEELDW